MYRAIILTIAAFCLFAGSAFAAVPQFINYQGLLQDTTGVPIADGPHLIKFIIWNDSTGTTTANEKWNSTFQSVNVSGGLFEYQLGSAVPLPDGLFSNDTILYLGVTEGANPEMLPRTKLVSVGYAFHALRADTADIAKLADSSATVSDNAITSTKIADATIDSADINTSQVQRRVTGTAAFGTAIRAINSDGSITATPVGTGDITGVAAGFGLSGGGNSGAVTLSLANGGVTSIQIADSTIRNIDISSHASIEVSKIRGTAVNLNSDQTITGNKVFTNTLRVGDSTFWATKNGITIGDFSNPTADMLIRAQRRYATTQNRYGSFTNLTNNTTGTLYGSFIALGTTADAGGERFGVYSSVDNANTSTADQYAVFAVAGHFTKTAGNSFGVYGTASSGTGSTAFGVYGTTSGTGTRNAGYFAGNVTVTGTLSKAAGAFKIDHPLDPANKYLVHSFVESPDMMNIYNGNVTTDGNGDAVVTLPDYFDALNKDFRYQLTVLGQFAQAIVSQKVSGNQFSIRTDLPNVEVSWQITGVRKDAYAEAHRIQVEPEKPIAEKGLYLHPVELGLSETKQLHYEMHKNAELERERIASESTLEQ